GSRLNGNQQIVSILRFMRQISQFVTLFVIGLVIALLSSTLPSSALLNSTLLSSATGITIGEATPELPRQSSTLARSERLQVEPNLVAQGLEVPSETTPSSTVSAEAAAAQQALDANDRPAAASIYAQLSLSYQDVQQWPDATVAIQTAQDILSERSGDRTEPRWQKAQAQVLNTLGRLEFSLGRSHRALRAWEQATEYYVQLSDSDGVAGSQINQAQALERLGYYRRACQTLLSAVQTDSNCDLTQPKIREQVQQSIAVYPNPQVQQLGLRNLSNVLRLIGYLEASERLLQQALATDSGQSHQETALTLLSLGNTTQAQYRRARLLYQQTGRRGDRQVTDALAQAALDAYQRAQETLNQDSHRSIPSSFNTQLQTQVRLYQLGLWLDIETWAQDFPTLADAGRYRLQIDQTAERLYTQELIQLPLSDASVNLYLSAARKFLVLQTLSADVKWFQQAYNFAQKAVEQSEQLNSPRLISTSKGLLGQVYERLSSSSASSGVDAAISTTDTANDASSAWQQSQSLTASALGIAQGNRLWDLAYQWQWQLGRLYRTENQIERAIAHYEAAVQSLNTVRSNLLGIDADIQFSFRDNVEPIYREWVELLLTTNQTSVPQHSLQQAIRAIDSLRVSELENFLQCNLNSAIEISQEQVDPTAAVLYPILLPNRLAVITRLPNTDRLNLHSVDISLDDVEKTVTQLRRELSKPYPSGAGRAIARDMYDWMIRPVESLLKTNDVKTLVFVLDGELRNVPMAVLNDGSQYLVEQYAIALMPGLQLIAPRPLAQLPLNVLTFGLSDIRPNFPPHNGFAALENVETELQRIDAQLNSRQFINQEFTEDTLKSGITSVSAPVVHLATHGQFSSEPEETFILAWDQRIDVNDLSSILQLRDETNNAIELLVLSACKTADGDSRAALGLAGVAVQSGARSTLASLWYVDDAGTATLMSQFYEELATADTPITKSEALRRAQVKLLQNPLYQAPLYWAPYVLVGNWL
ncbi:MAG: CHAT domain-containing protein, partial [Cyanobacteria bacterium J06626_14]